jgi:hypothetical protein
MVTRASARERCGRRRVGLGIFDKTSARGCNDESAPFFCVDGHRVPRLAAMIMWRGTRAEARLAI